MRRWAICVFAVLLVVMSVQGFTFRRSFKNGYPAKLNVSKEEARDTFHIGRGGTVQSDGFGQVNVVRTVNDLAGTVVEVIDGATIGLELPGGGVTRVRLRGLVVIDPMRPSGKKCKEHLEALLLNKQVRVEWRQKDRNGYVFGTVFQDVFGGESVEVNRRMLEDGYAQAVSGYDPRYTSTQGKARAEGKGLWGKTK